MSSPPGEWSPLKVTGQAPPPCSLFTLTTVGEKRAAMFGGYDGSNRFNHLFIVELGRHSVVSVFTTCIQNYYQKLHLIKISKILPDHFYLSDFVPGLCDTHVKLCQAVVNF